MEHREAKTTAEGSLTISIGKPNKEGIREVSGEFTVKKFVDDTTEVFEKRYDYFHRKLMNEIVRT